MSRPILADYTRAGFALVPIPYGTKGPVAPGWNARSNCITDPDIAEWLDGNVGLAHAYSGTCCLDIDDMPAAEAWFTDRGVALSDWLNAEDAVRISSGRVNRAKLLYALPTPLASFKLPGFELRCASRSGSTVQDVLPPSIHPDTGKPYEWVLGEAAHWALLPPIPDALRALWLSLLTPETRVRPATTQATGASLKALAATLENHDPDAGYEAWLRVGMALHHETAGSGAGFKLWDEWSARGQKYKGSQDLVNHWRSFQRTDDPVTMASLRVERPASAAEFEALGDDPEPAPTRTLTSLEGVRVTRTKDGTFKATLPNLQYVLLQPGAMENRVAYDAFLDALMIAPDGKTFRPVRDTDYTRLRLHLENALAFEPVGRELIRDIVHWLGDLNTMDSAHEWLTSLKWDGVKRVERFLPAYMGSPDTEYEQAVSRYLWTALAGRVMEPGCQVDMVPILVGRQGLGKSQGVRAMSPTPECYVEIRLDDRDDDIARKMRGTLIGEIAELRGLRTADLDKIKAFVTRMDEKWTPKYQEFATTFKRRLVMIGTSNDSEFLTDDENRRWLPVRTAGVKVDAIKRDRDQLWAEGLAMWQTYGIHWQKAEQLAKAVHNEYRVEDTWETIVQTWVFDNHIRELTLHQVFEHVLGVDHRHVNRMQEQRLSKVLRALGFERETKRINGKVTRIWANSIL